jgi:tetratricopeptide (TPR) repeat protein/predicted Ser/Thr protein kinase
MKCPTGIDLERWLAGETAAEDSAQLEAHCAGCADCSRRVEDARSDELLVAELRRAARPRSAAVTASEPALARYSILGRLGEGGMGVVYEAEQRGTRRRVALKVLRAGLLSQRALRRFEHEAEILARLDHPGIARVLEADTFESGGERQPFFAMELVEGRSLLEAAAELGRSERVALLARLCDAVHHAHQKGVLHRDLKPANVRVRASGEPVILDFGVARAVDEGLRASGTLSLAGEILGTLPYMSPEQLSGDPLAVDARSDVFALGVILFELLAGRRPRDATGMTLPEAVRVLATTPAPRLWGSASGADRDLEALAGKALELDPARRYDSAASLADDLRRWLAGDPLEARPPTAIERAAHFARRNRGTVAVVGLVFALLLGGILAVAWQSDQARLAREESEERGAAARAAAARAERINELLLGVIRAGNPMSRANPAEYTVREALEEAESRLNDPALDDPAAEADLRAALGSSWLALELPARAEPQLERALELRKQLDDAPALAEVHNELAVLRLAQRRFEWARDEALTALALYGEDPQTAARRGASETNVAAALAALEDMDGAREHYQRALELLRASLGEGTRYEANVLGLLAMIDLAEGRRGDAMVSLRRAVAIQRSGELGQHPQAALQLANLAVVLSDEDELEEAEELTAEALAVQRRILGPRSPQVLQSLHNLAEIERRLGRSAAAVAHAEEALALLREIGAPEAKLAETLVALGLARGRAGDAAGAEDALLEGLDLIASASSLSEAFVAAAHIGLARALLAQGRLDEVEPHLAESLELLGGDRASPEAVAARVVRAELHARTGRTAEAEALLRAELAPVERAPVALRAVRAEAYELLGELLQAQGHADGARSALEEAVALYGALPGDRASELTRTRARIAALAPRGD